jgi:Leucine-rich repeat (LRR) protein
VAVKDALPLLTGLDVRSNRIANISSLSSAGALIELLASFNQIDAIPVGVFSKCSETLKCVDFSHNLIASVPTEIFAEMPRLEILDLSYNCLNSLALEAFPLHNLTTLDLSYNAIAKLGPEFGLLTKLTKFKARSNCISAIEFSFADLQELKILDLSYNRLRSLPEDLV